MPQPPKALAQALGEALGANVIQVIGGMIVLQRPIDEEKVREKAAGEAEEGGHKPSAQRKKEEI